MRLYAIRSLELTNEDDGAPLYWSNQDGWIGYDPDAITVFTEAERKAFSPPMGMCEWIVHT